MPVTVTLSIACKGLSFENVDLSVTDNLLDVRRILQQCLENIGDPMTSEFGTSNVFVLRRYNLFIPASCATMMMLCLA